MNPSQEGERLAEEGMKELSRRSEGRSLKGMRFEEKTEGGLKDQDGDDQVRGQG